MEVQSSHIRAMTTRSMVRTNNANEISMEAKSLCYCPLDNYEIRNLPLVKFSVYQVSDDEYKLGPTIYSRRTKLTKYIIVTKSMWAQTIIKNLQSATEPLVEQQGTSCRIEYSDELFAYIDRPEFKNASNCLKNVSVALMRPIIEIESADMCQELIKHFHTHPLEGGHAGFKRLYAKLRIIYKWKGMARYVSKFLRECGHCSTNTP